MSQDSRLRAFVDLVIDQLFWARGGEEHVDPLAPLRAYGYPVPWLGRGSEPSYTPHPEPWHRSQPVPWLGPQPEPWFRQQREIARLGHHRDPHEGVSYAAICQLIQAARIKQVAGRLAEGPHRASLLKAANDSIKDAIDELCPRPVAIPWPKPRRVFETVAELARIADSFAEGPVRDELLNAAAEVTRKDLQSA